MEAQRNNSNLRRSSRARSGANSLGNASPHYGLNTSSLGGVTLIGNGRLFVDLRIPLNANPREPPNQPNLNHIDATNTDVENAAENRNVRQRRSRRAASWPRSLRNQAQSSQQEQSPLDENPGRITPAPGGGRAGSSSSAPPATYSQNLWDMDSSNLLAPLPWLWAIQAYDNIPRPILAEMAASAPEMVPLNAVPNVADPIAATQGMDGTANLDQESNGDQTGLPFPLNLDIGRTYEELLNLAGRIGVVPTGLTGEEIERRIKPHKHCPIENASVEDVGYCCVCLDEFMKNDDMGKLDCGHEFHFACIKQWLMEKNNCPICKRRGLAAPK